MIIEFLFYFFNSALSECDKYIDFNGTSFYFSYYIFTDEILCINSSKDDWSFILNEGITSFSFTAYYRDQTGRKQFNQDTSDFLGIHIYGSDSSIEIKSRERSILSFSIVSFDNDCAIRIISNYIHDNISAKDWTTPEFANNKLCYFNGLYYKTRFMKKSKSTVATFHNSDGSYFPWLSTEYESYLLHPPILELLYDENAQIFVFSNDFSKMNHGRSILISNSTYRKTTVFKGVPYDPSVCTFYDFINETNMIFTLNISSYSVQFIALGILIAYIVTYCSCCSCCRLYRPSCLYCFGLKPTQVDNDHNNPNLNENCDIIPSPNIQQPIYYVFQQHISQNPQPNASNQTADEQLQQPLMSVTTNPPPGVYEPVRVSAPIVPVTIVNDDDSI